MSTSLKIIQFYGWEGENVFDALIALTDETFVVNYITKIKNLFLDAMNNINFTPKNKSDVIDGKDLFEYYQNNSSYPPNNEIIKRVGDPTTLEFIMYNLYEFVNFINNEKDMRLELASINNVLCLYLENYISDCIDISESDSLIFNLKLPHERILKNIAPESGVITKVYVNYD